MFDLQKRLYFASPVWLQRAYATVPYSVRMGRHFRRTWRILVESEQWDDEAVRNFQVEQLRKLLRSALTKVPFYREWARREQASAEDFRSPEDIRRLPLVSKDAMRENFEAFAAEGKSRFSYAADYTGGTTSRAFGFLADNWSYRIEQAFMLYQWQRVGFTAMTPKATLRGRAVANPKTANRWVYNPVHNEVVLSIYELCEESLADYVTACAKYKIRFLHGFPSATSILARLLVNNEKERKRFPALTAVLSASEAPFPGQRELIEEAFRCRVFSWYGMSERVILAGECEVSRQYHCFPQYGITELIDSEERHITEPGVEGELVGTSFYNYVMPFIRYRTGDYASWAPSPCPHCRRPYPLVDRVRGRWNQDYLFGVDGRPLPLTGIVGALHGSQFDHVERYQFYQDTPGRVELRIVHASGFGEEDIQMIRSGIEEKIGGLVHLEIKLVETISRTERGKAIYLIQNSPQAAMISTGEGTSLRGLQ